MAIQKIKRATKQGKAKQVESVETSSDLEEKRKKFQSVVAGGEPVVVTVAAPPKHHSASRRTLIIIVGALMAVIGTVAVAFAYFWYQQSPDRIVMDAVMHSLDAKSTRYEGKLFLLGSPEPQITYKGAFGDGKSKLDVTVGMPSGIEFTQLNTSTVATKDDLYLKIDQASRLISETAPPAIKETFEPHLSLIRQEVDGKWLKVNPSDIDMYQPITQVSQCAASLFQLFTTSDSSAYNKVFDVYKQYPFLKVSESAHSTGQIGKYLLTLDADTYDQFKEKLYKSAFYASLALCNREAHDIKTNDIRQMAITLTIDKSKREVIDMVMTQGGVQGSKLVLTPVFNETVSVQVPTETARIGDIQAKALRSSVQEVLQRAQ